MSGTTERAALICDKDGGLSIVIVYVDMLQDVIPYLNGETDMDTDGLRPVLLLKGTNDVLDGLDFDTPDTFNTVIN